MIWFTREPTMNFTNTAWVAGNIALKNYPKRQSRFRNPPVLAHNIYKTWGEYSRLRKKE
jgi:hypothetical protein